MSTTTNDDTTVKEEDLTGASEQEKLANALANGDPDDEAVNAEAAAADEQSNAEPEQAEEAAAWDTAISETKDDTISAVLTELKESGISQDKAKELLFDAVQSGDPSKIDFAALTEAVGSAARAHIIKRGCEAVIAEQRERSQAVITSLHDVAGSVDNWTKVAEYAKAKVSEADLNEYRAMINNGGNQAKLAAKALVELYNADPSNTSLGAAERSPNKGGASPAPAKGISHDEYTRAYQDAERKGNLSEALRRQLFNRRQLGKKQGL